MGSVNPEFLLVWCNRNSPGSYCVALEKTRDHHTVLYLKGRSVLFALLAMMFHSTIISAVLLTAQVVGSFGAHDEFKILEGHTVREAYTSPLPYTYINEDDLPDNFNWGNVDGKSYLTRSLNQHIPQYCGSCWAHGALSALGDRIKITNSSMDEIGLSIQYILNCGGGVAGSCHGGSGSGTYDFISKTGYVPYDTCLPYVACSSESSEGFCKHVDTSCKAINVCKTCDTFGGMGGKCTEIDYFPNASIAEYGMYSIMTSPTGVAHKIQAEIYARGPVSAGVNADPLVKYQGGIVTDTKIYHMMINHIVSIVGWGTDIESGQKYWIVRNSWGQFWGEMGYFRILMGHNSLGIEMEIAWASPGRFTVQNYPCYENGENCVVDATYTDPSKDIQSIQHRLKQDKMKEAVMKKLKKDQQQQQQQKQESSLRQS